MNSIFSNGTVKTHFEMELKLRYNYLCELLSQLQSILSSDFVLRTPLISEEIYDIHRSNIDDIITNLKITFNSNLGFTSVSVRKENDHYNFVVSLTERGRFAYDQLKLALSQNVNFDEHTLEIDNEYVDKKINVMIKESSVSAEIYDYFASHKFLTEENKKKLLLDKLTRSLNNSRYERF